MLRSPADIYLAWLTTLAGHEFGHCQQAWLGGAKRCEWISAPGPYALGHIISIPGSEAAKLSAAGRQAVTAGGTVATVAGADQLKREIFEPVTRRGPRGRCLRCVNSIWPSMVWRRRSILRRSITRTTW